MAKNFDLYQHVTDKIVSAVERDPKGWQRPWIKMAGQGLPFNVRTGRSYSGINVPLLWIEAEARGYALPVWATYKQWEEIGCQVRKGEKSAMVVFYRELQRASVDNPNGDPDSYRVLRYYRVFNAAQVDGYEAPEVDYPGEAERIEAAEDYVANTGAVIRHDFDGAFYRPSEDFIGMPQRHAFRATPYSSATEAYYATLLHELTHWTGAEARLDRKAHERFKDMTFREAYAMEELVAEMGAAFLCASLGVTPEPRLDHAQYLNHWLKVLKEDKKAIFWAAARARDAADFLDALQFEDRPPAGPGTAQPCTSEGPALPAPATPPAVIYLPAPAPLPALPVPVAAEDPEPPFADDTAEKPKYAKVGGLKVKLRWPWSRSFRNWVHRQARTLATYPHGEAQDRSAAIAYGRWLAERDGLGRLVKGQPAKAIKQGDRWKWIVFGDKAVIEIPNHDAQPRIEIRTIREAA